MAWSIGWNRRKPKLVRGSTAGSQTNYQLKLTIYKGSGIDTDNTIYLEGHVNDNFSDLRFTSSDETTLLPYWIESYNSGVSAIVWIKIDSIPSDPFSKTIYIYYDNPSATSVSNGNTTFDFFDDFPGTTLDTTKWNINSGLEGSQFAVTGGNLQMTAGTGIAGELQGKISFSYPIIKENRLRFSSTLTNLDMGVVLVNTLYVNDIGAYTRNTNGKIAFFCRSNGSLTIHYDIVMPGMDSYHIYKFIWQSSNVGLYQDNILIDSITSNIPTVNLSDYYRVDATGFGTQYIDWTRIRKYASPEPTWSTTSPEQIYTANLTVSSVPTGAEIWINNIDQGVTTTSWFTVNPGTYTIMLTKPGYDDYIEIITLSSNQNATVQGNLVLSGAPICSSTLKYSGDLVHLQATPKDATGPYYVEFRKNNSPISSLSNVIEDTLITYDYLLTDLDISSAITGTIDFSVYISDSCPTGSQTCTQNCTVNIGCIAPLCNFTVT